MSGSPATVVIAAGGTGGHIYPGLALAAALRAQAPDVRITFVGTAKGMEGELVPAAGHDLRLYSMLQFNSLGWRKALVPGSLARGTGQARAILRNVRADVAVSMGGYSGVPLIVGAKLSRLPSIVFEPGAVPGQANRLSARFSQHVATAFPDTRFGTRAVRYVGYPLQGFIAGFDRDALRGEARRTLLAEPLADDVKLVTVIGASQGSLTLNRLALGLAERWRDRTDLRILLKAGSRTHDEVAAALAANSGRHLVDLVRYIDRMDHAYAAADLAICRSGAGTVTELSVVGLPAVLVPFPAFEHDEQGHNAQLLVKPGGALLVRDHDATADVVGPLVEPLLADPSELARMRSALAGVARPDAADVLAEWVLSLAGARAAAA